MPDGGETARIEVIQSLGAVNRAEWDACAGDDNPFLSYDFLYSLEKSGSVRAETGWLPQHLLLRDETGRLTAAAPLYLKGHSHGEYVFDYAWAHAYERAGGRYYPKLLSAVPFTPVTGPRLLVENAKNKPLAAAQLASGMIELTARHETSSLHVNFTDDFGKDVLEEQGFLIREGHQYHWTNDLYRSFDDFLNALSSRKRKSIRKERRAVTEAGIDIRTLTGDELQAEHWDAFYRFYIDTYDRKWGAPYLTREFFDLLQERMADRVVLVLAYVNGRAIAGALNLRGRTALYGRNWGCEEDYKFLHFEACYYQAIEFAIEHGLSRVEAGTQGEHKIQRGYLPVPTYSAHWIPDVGFRNAVADFLRQERHYEVLTRQELAEMSPFKSNN